MSQPNREEMAANDSALRHHAATRSEAISRLEESAARIAELQGQIKAGEFNVDTAADMVASGNFEVPKAVDLSSQRAELLRVESTAAALRLGIEKIDEAIADRNRALDGEYLAVVAAYMAQQLGPVFDALLTIAESAEDFKRVASMASHLCNHIRSPGLPFWRMTGGPTGTRGTAADYINEMAKLYEGQFGFRLSGKQAARLAALAV